jgi:hypothetical protein
MGNCKPYKASDITNENGKYYLQGPGNGFGYYSGTLCPHLQFDDRDKAVIAAEIANIAYDQGMLKTRLEIRAALGL